MPSRSVPLSPPFELQAREILAQVRTAIRGLVVPLVGKSDVRVSDLVQTFTLDTRLAWKLVKVLTATDGLRAVKYLPGQRGVRLFLRSAARLKAPALSIKSVQTAFDALQAFIEQEAGDRYSFDMIAAGHATETEDDPGLEHRRIAFEQNGYIWGVQARTQIHTYLIQPAQDPRFLDMAVLRGYVGLRRLRSQTPWRISRFYSVDDAGQVYGAFRRAPLDPDCGPDDVPLWREFCSQPLPSVRRIVGSHGIVDDVLAESDVGNTQSVTCLTAEVIRHADSAFASEQNTGLGTLAPLRTPCERVVMDVFMRRDFLDSVRPEVRVLSDLFMETLGAPHAPSDTLPCRCAVEELPRSPRIPPIGEVANYSAMISSAFERLEWNASDFRCYRMRLEFPPIPAALVADFPLPPLIES